MGCFGRPTPFQALPQRHAWEPLGTPPRLNTTGASTESVRPHRAQAHPARLPIPYPSGLIEPTGNSLGLLTQAGGTVNFNDQFRRSPYFQKWSIDIQRDIGSTFAVSVGYLGSKGSSLAIGGTGDNTVNINQLDPQYLSMGTALDELLPNPFPWSIGVRGFE